jgi:hypothetical protein
MIYKVSMGKRAAVRLQHDLRSSRELEALTEAAHAVSRDRAFQHRELVGFACLGDR